VVFIWFKKKNAQFSFAQSQSRAVIEKLCIEIFQLSHGCASLSKDGLLAK